MKYFFIHIPKTAGTSLRELLYRNVAPELRLSVYPGNENDPSWVSYEKLSLNPESYQDRQYFIGHFNYGLHRILGVPDAECRYLTLLRNPVSRVVSLYKHFLSFPGSPEHDLIIDGQLSLLQFLQHGQASYQAINHMTKILADRDMAHKIDETDFEHAISNIG